MFWACFSFAIIYKWKNIYIMLEFLYLMVNAVHISVLWLPSLMFWTLLRRWKLGLHTSTEDNSWNLSLVWLLVLLPYVHQLLIGIGQQSFTLTCVTECTYGRCFCLLWCSLQLVWKSWMKLKWSTLPYLVGWPVLNNVEHLMSYLLMHKRILGKLNKLHKFQVRFIDWVKCE